jgi:hypothetical protein
VPEAGDVDALVWLFQMQICRVHDHGSAGAGGDSDAAESSSSQNIIMRDHSGGSEDRRVEESKSRMKSGLATDEHG